MLIAYRGIYTKPPLENPQQAANYAKTKNFQWYPLRCLIKKQPNFRGKKSSNNKHWNWNDLSNKYTNCNTLSGEKNL